MTTKTSKIIWTEIDEAPALATYSLLPIVQAFTKGTGVSVETRDISLAGRIVANFPENLTEAQRIPDDLAELGALTQTPEANIIKLPNISASVPQLKEAIKELQAKGYKVPDYPEVAKNDAEKAIQARYAKVPRQRREPGAPRGQLRPPLAARGEERSRRRTRTSSAPGAPSRRPHVAHMSGGDFYGNETVDPSRRRRRVPDRVRRRRRQDHVLKKNAPLLEGEIIDAHVHERDGAPRSSTRSRSRTRRRAALLLSLHLKATMMKVSDPVMFGHAVDVFFKDVFDKHAATFKRGRRQPEHRPRRPLQEDPVAARRRSAPRSRPTSRPTYAKRPALAMVDSDKGITNLHVPNDIIVDASMPVVVRESGKMWDPDGKLQDTKAMIPDRCYSTIYKEIIEDCKKFGALNPATMGSVPNVGLMAQKAEEYGSHDKTFDGPRRRDRARRRRAPATTLLEQKVEAGDILRMCQAKDVPIRTG